MSFIEIENLEKSYGKNKTALTDINLTLESGKIIGLLGSNGSGKTTLIKILAGLLTPDQGTVTINGEQIGVETKKIVSYLPDVSYINDNYKLYQVLDFFQTFYEDFHRKRAEDMLDILKIDPKAKYKTLSKGMKEKVQLVLVMSRKAKLYLLDEPIAGVDPASRDYILNTILKNYDETATIIITTHLISDIESILDQVVLIKESHLYAVTSVDEIRESHNQSLDEYFREVFKCDF